MKKFLSLVLALIMTMSLVTISAGATEYKDLTDKDEIQYEEAVAVLNRIGIITGYDDGSFRPETELTRGAAAKIIVSLMIGPDAANALPNTYAPYPDVPAGHTFAGVISYCKTAGYISGYGDGTFKPANSLTGFAFAKMLLGALGYKSDSEGFTGTGWTMNVAKLGNAAGLFNRLSFQGADAVNREEACQLALNTLKATMVEYTGGFNVVTGDAQVIGAQTRTYVTSNQEYATHISNLRAGGLNSGNGNAVSDQHYTVEFGEEHFKDLRLEAERRPLDDFGRPSNEWSYKKVTIGTFPVEPDFVYTTQVTAVNDIKVTKATKIRDLGLNGYEVDGATLLKVNGETVNVFNDDNNIERIADYTDNGTVVEVYVAEDDADYVENVVVVKTQLMEVKKIGSDYVTLGEEDDCDENGPGFNQLAIAEKVDDVEVNDAYYEFLKGLKAGDEVAVIPVTTDEGESWAVAKAYTPETVSGSLDGSKSFANTTVTDPNRSVIEVTVGGTAYKVATWNKDLQSANRDVIKVTNKDVTLLLDEHGNALKAKDIGSTSEYMILGAWRNAVVDGVLVRLATGWDVKGKEVSLNVGSEQSNAVKNYANYQPGDVLRYTNDGVTGNAEWKLSKNGVFLVPGNEKVLDRESYAIKASNSAVTVSNYDLADNRVLKASGIKTIYVAFDDDEVDYIEIQDGLQNISANELDYTGSLTNRAHQGEATVSKLSGGKATEKSEVTYVVVKKESNDATLKNLGFVWKNDNTTNNKDEDGNVLTKYNVFTVDDDNVSMTANKSITNYHFVRFKALDEDGRYDLKDYDYRQRTTSVAKVVATAVVSPNSNNLIGLNGEYRRMDGTLLPVAAPAVDAEAEPNISLNKAGYGTDLTVGDKYADLINIKGAKFLDLTRSTTRRIDDADDLKETLKDYDVEMSIAFNDNPDNDEFRLTYIIVVTGLKAKGETPTSGTGAVKLANGLTGVGTIKDSKVEVDEWGEIRATFTLTKPSWAYAVSHEAPESEPNCATISYDLYQDGVAYKHGVAPITAGLDSDHGYLVANGDTDDEITEFTGTYRLTKDGGMSWPSDLRTQVGHTYSIVITGIEWRAAAVKYVYTDGSKVATVPNTAKYVLNDGGAKTVGFTLAAAAPANGKYTLSGVKTGGSIAENTWKDVSFTGGQGWITMNFTQVKNQGVTVTITPDTGYVTKYPVTILGDSAHYEAYIKDVATGLPADYNNNSAKISIDADTYAVEEGKSVTFTVKGEQLTGHGLIWAYDVSYKINGKPFGCRLDPKGSTATVPVDNKKVGDVTGKVELTDLVVEPVMVGLYVTGVTVVNDTTLEITFNKDIDANIDRGNITYHKSGSTLAALHPTDKVTTSGKVLTVEFHEDMADNAKLDIDAAIFENGTTNRNKEVVIVVSDVSEKTVTFSHNG